MFAQGETVYLGCQARGCGAPGRTLALYRNGLNLGSPDRWITVYNFDSQHAGTYTCRPIPPQNVQSPPLVLAMGCEWLSCLSINVSNISALHKICRRNVYPSISLFTLIFS